MRIIVIGGYAPSLLNFRGPLLRAMIARGHAVTALAADGTPEIARELARIGVAYREIPIARAGLDPRADLRTLEALVAILRELRPDLVLTYTIKPVIYGQLAARLAGVPRRVALITGLGYALGTAANAKQRAVAFVARSLYRLALSSTDVVFFQNSDDRAAFERLGLVSRATRVSVVRGSGVDLDQFPERPLNAGALRFLFLGRLLYAKGILEYVEMARRVRAVRPDTTFSIVGWLDPNPASASRADVDQWVSNGWVEYAGARDDVRDVLAWCHVLVHPSHHEGTPRAVLEAMSTGRAVITTDAPGCRETIVDRESGRLVPLGDAEALAAAGLELCEKPALVADYARRARRRAEELYDAHQVAAHMLDFMGISHANTGDRSGH